MEVKEDEIIKKEQRLEVQQQLFEERLNCDWN